MIHRLKVNEWVKTRNWVDMQLFLKGLLWLLFFIYLFVLLKIDLFEQGRSWVESHSVNWVPMNRINTLFYLSDHHDPGYQTALLRTFQSFAIFIPMGFLVPALRKKAMEFEQFIGVPLAIALSIEFAQYVLMTGRSDVDDLILNVLGSMLGFALWHLFCEWIPMHRINRYTRIFLITLLISICLLLFNYDGMTFDGSADINRDTIGVTLGIPEYTGAFLRGNKHDLIMKTDPDQGNIQVTISINESTKLYLEKATDYGDSSKTAALKKITVNRMRQVDENAKIRVWGKQLPTTFLAEFVIVR
ncbi:VanZ family protein [Sporolactobacillus nakayamae]|uniref:Glycopeptide antibiotics resistance protein n=1 Tax=Sporolactobacillus nakayamae TaxID=269670 RepID=A0A1I2V541_9BACL|nr:VanZ family protein [Sporolactobacillus nakayamae]SFG84342.1 Glycopeptide antibiotics resistance protein [Sporolactobacillus nakayamae]